MNTFKKTNNIEIIKMNKFISENIENIHMILISVDMVDHIKNLDKCDIRSTDSMYYLNIPIQVLTYFPPNKINFVFKDKYIKFDIPCMCGNHKI